MVMVEGPWAGRAGSAIRWPAWTTSGFGRGRDAGDEEQQEGEQAREHGRIPRKGGGFHATARGALTSEKPGALGRPGLSFPSLGSVSRYQKKS